MKTNLEHFGEPASCSNLNGLALLEQCQNSGLRCGDCRLNNPLGPIAKPCSESWDAAPYGMPLDKRIEWYEERTSQNLPRPASDKVVFLAKGLATAACRQVALLPVRRPPVTGEQILTAVMMVTGVAAIPVVLYILLHDILKLFQGAV